MLTEPTIITEGIPEGYLIVADEQNGRFYPQRRAGCGGTHRFATRRALDGGNSHTDTPISFAERELAKALIAKDALAPREISWGSIIYSQDELPKGVTVILHQGVIALEDMTGQGMLYPGFAHGHLTREQEIHYDVLEVPIEHEPEGRSIIYYLIRDSWPDEPKEITADGSAKTVLEIDGYCFFYTLVDAQEVLKLKREQLAEE